MLILAELELTQQNVSVTPEVHIFEIQYRSADYDRALELRERVLRAPLGLTFSKKQLKAESEECHVVAQSAGGEILASASIVWKAPTTAKLRQVVVAPDFQSQGLGTRIVQFAESIAQQKERTLIYCHARKPVTAFYTKLGFQIVGSQFEEIGIDHFRMEKGIPPR
tara:strand:+ start:2030 stop:2527 length:498 start_codon:yes stop_codon:yes gene_type:complete